MEEVLQGLGVFALVVLGVVGALAGLVAGKLSRGRTGAYVVIGVVGAVAMPFVMGALGATALVAGGVVVLALVALAGALIALAIGRVVMGR